MRSGASALLGVLVMAFAATGLVGMMRPAAAAAREEAPGVSFRPRWVIDQRHRFRIASESTLTWSETGVAEAGATVRSKQRIEVSFTVVGTDERGAATLAGVVDSASLERTSGGSPPADAAEKLQSALKESVLRIDIAPDGTISGLTGLEKVAEAAGTMGRAGDECLGVLAPASIRRTLELLWRVDQPKRPKVGAEAQRVEFEERTQGQSWSVEDVRPLGERRLLFTETEYTLEALEEPIARLKAVTKRTIKTDPGAGPTLPVLSIDDQSAREEVGWSWEIGGVSSRDVSARYKVRSKLGEGRAAWSGVECRVTIERLSANK